MLFLHKTTGPKALPPALRGEIVSRFYVDAERSLELRYLDREGHYAGQPVRYVRIFDPGLVNDPNAIQRYEDISGPCLLFEGRIAKSGAAKLRDRRMGILLGPKPRLQRAPEAGQGPHTDPA